MRQMLWVFLIMPTLGWSDEWRLSVADWSRLAGLETTRTMTLDAPGARDVDGRLVFERVELRAPGAEVWAMVDGERRALPPTGQVVLSGRDPARPDWRFTLVFDSDGQLAAGAVYADRGLQSLRAYADRDSILLRAFDIDDLLPDGVRTDFQCANEALQSVADYELPLAGAGARIQGAPRSDTLRVGVLTIDTDKEWLEKRFSDNVANAAAWIEQLVAVTNVLFERDVNLRMLQGETILRVGSDPYTAGGSAANRERLEEFGQYWFSNFASTPRTHAALISGRSSSGNSAAGIAWLNTYCRQQRVGGSYSLNQLFWNQNIGVNSSARIFAHEIGHNLGSVHTHCYNPPVDQCYNAESGCFDGTPSCPAGGSGTLMSYCNFPGPSGANCGQARLELHPTVASLIDSRIEANYPACIQDFVEDEVVIDPLFEDRFET